MKKCTICGEYKDTRDRVRITYTESEPSRFPDMSKMPPDEQVKALLPVVRKMLDELWQCYADMEHLGIEEKDYEHHKQYCMGVVGIPRHGFICCLGGQVLLLHSLCVMKSLINNTK